MNFKNYLFIFLIVSVSLFGKCKRADRMHVDKNIVRCRYKQEDIYRHYGNKAQCHNCEQYRKECFYCGCPIEEHTKFAKKKTITPKA